MNADADPPGRKPFDPGRVKPRQKKGPGDQGTGGPGDQGTGEPHGQGLFDPPPTGATGGLSASASTRRGDGPALLTVSQLTRLVKGAIKKTLPADVHVVGELSNVASPASGHFYFTLKDESSEVACVMWRSSAKSLPFRLTDGLAVMATGSVDVYEPRGQYQLYVRRLEPQGVGALELAFRQLKQRLDSEGLFDPARKRPLPRFPRRIALVTSPTGAAVRDVLQSIQRRYPCVDVLLFPVRVQGEGAAREVADAIRRLNHAGPGLGGIDVMIVGRGGGSLEDVWAFNEEEVARAIHASRIPIVSAVGHEIDFTIADFVADVRAATPTAAAELVVPDRGELLVDLDARQHRLGRSVHHLLDGAKVRLSALERSQWFRDPLGRLRQHHQQVDESAGRLQLAVTRALSRTRSAIHDMETRLARVRPAAVLARRRERLLEAEHRLRWAHRQYSVAAERRLGEIASRLAAASPQGPTERGTILLDQLSGRLHRGISRLIDDRHRAVAAQEARLAASSHQQILGRGFSITRVGKRGKIIRKASDAQQGDKLLTETSEGSIASRVVDERQGELFD